MPVFNVAYNYVLWLPASSGLPTSGTFNDSGGIARFIGVVKAGGGYNLTRAKTVRDSEGLDRVLSWKMDCTVEVFHALDTTTRSQLENQRGFLLFLPKKNGWFIPDSATNTALNGATGVQKPGTFLQMISVFSTAVFGRWHIEEKKSFGTGLVDVLTINGSGIGKRSDLERSIVYYF